LRSFQECLSIFSVRLEEVTTKVPVELRPSSKVLKASLPPSQIWPSTWVT
jgi:hypothetical protein